MLGSFDYHRAASIKECCSLLERNDGTTKILAGGTDLLVDIRGSLVSPDLLIDIKHIPALKTMTVRKGRGFSVGAAVTLSRLIEECPSSKSYRALRDAAQSIGTYQLRNRATAVGNLCNASPAADLAPPLMVLKAGLKAEGPKGARTIPVEGFFLGVKKSALARGEMVTGIEVPQPPGGARTAFLKKKRIRGHDLAVVNMAGYYDSRTRDLRVCIGSCAETPVLLPGMKDICRGKISPGRLASRANEIAQDALCPISDPRSSATYRRDMVAVLLRRLIEDLCGQARSRAT